jgi:hypothetical protein
MSSRAALRSLRSAVDRAYPRCRPGVVRLATEREIIQIDGVTAVMGNPPPVPTPSRFPPGVCQTCGHADCPGGTVLHIVEVIVDDRGNEVEG